MVHSHKHQQPVVAVLWNSEFSLNSAVVKAAHDQLKHQKEIPTGDHHNGLCAVLSVH